MLAAHALRELQQKPALQAANWDVLTELPHVLPIVPGQTLGLVTPAELPPVEEALPPVAVVSLPPVA